MATGDRKQPLTGFRYLVEIDSLVVGGFKELSGLEAETEIEEYREGGVNSFVWKLPGITKYSNIKMKRGFSDSETLWNWYKRAANGSIERKNGSVIMLDHAGHAAWRWDFSQAYPVRWVGPELRADQSSVAIEMIEIAHNGLIKHGGI